MREFALHDVREALRTLGILSGDTALVHASLLRLGRLTNHSSQETPRAIVATMLDLVGTAGTLAMPAFNFDFCSGKPFDRQRTSCAQMGQLAETLRQWPGSQRSRHPLQSISAFGARADIYCQDLGEKAFVEDSAFGRLLRDDVWVVLFGIDFQAASLIHAAEERVGVPYRYWKEFRGPYHDNGQSHDHSCWMYARDLQLDPQLDMSKVEAELATRNQLASVAVGGGTVRAVRAQHLVTAAEIVLKRDPMALVASRRDIS